MLFNPYCSRKRRNDLMGSKLLKAMALGTAVYVGVKVVRGMLEE